MKKLALSCLAFTALTAATAFGAPSNQPFIPPGFDDIGVLEKTDRHVDSTSIDDVNLALEGKKEWTEVLLDQCMQMFGNESCDGAVDALTQQATELHKLRDAPVTARMDITD